MPKNKQKKSSPIITPVEWFDDRFYTIEFNEKEIYRLPSVSCKLSVMVEPFLLRHYGELGFREAQRKLEEAGDSGSRIHHAVYCYVNRGLVLYQPPWNKKQIWKPEDMERFREQFKDNIVILSRQDEAVKFWNFERWFNGLGKPLVVGSEMSVYSIKHRYAGTLDHIFQIQKDQMHDNLPYTKGFWIYDGKSGGENPKHRCQIAAYWNAVIENEICEPAGAIIHYWSKNKIVFLPPSELKKSFEDFLKIAAVWDLENPNITPDAFQFPSAFSQESFTKTKRSKK